MNAAAPDATVLAAAAPQAAERSRRQAEVVGALGAALLALRRLEKIREEKKTAGLGEEARVAS